MTQEFLENENAVKIDKINASLINRIEELGIQIKMLNNRFIQSDADFYIMYGVLVRKGIIDNERFQKRVTKMKVEVEKREQYLKKYWKKLHKKD